MLLLVSVYVCALVCIHGFCVCRYMCPAYVREVFYLGLLSVYSVCVCVNIRVVWSGFGPPGMSMQNLSTFHRSFILVLVLAQYSHWVTQWEVYLPACGRRHRNLTLWR